MTPVLTITGSDSTGGSGIQADIKTITALGGVALTAITSVTLQSSRGISNIYDLPANILVEQVRSIVNTDRPKAIKVGLVRDADAIKALHDDIAYCKRMVCAPGLMSSHGIQLVHDKAIEAVSRFFIPEAALLLLRCNEAELLLNMDIATDDDMVKAARELTALGARNVLLRNGRHHADDMLTALFYGEGVEEFYTSRNTVGWQKHGVSAALSTAIATRMAFGDDTATAIRKAHDYIHRQIVYAVTPKIQGIRPADLYNQFMSLIAQYYREAHDVAFYAEKLSISTRYLSQVTEKVVGKSPKQLIADYLMMEARVQLDASTLTIQEVSDKLGFSSQSLFSRFFHSQQGCSPKEYRGN